MKPLSFSSALASGTASELFQFFISPDISDELGTSSMEALLEDRPAVAKEVLCLMYDVAWYKVGESCFGPAAPEEDQEKWFVATPNDSPLSATVPLANSESEAISLAVSHLKLDKIFFGEAQPC